MPTEVFADAGFWIALAYERDKHHRDAMNRWQFVTNQDMKLITTNWTLYEALTFLNSRERGRHDLAMGLLRLTNMMVEIIDASQFEQRALDVFTSHADKRWSIVDCANFVCIRERGAPLALSFDRDFAQAQVEFGFEALGSRVNR